MGTLPFFSFNDRHFLYGSQKVYNNNGILINIVVITDPQNSKLITLLISTIVKLST